MFKGEESRQYVFAVRMFEKLGPNQVVDVTAVRMKPRSEYHAQGRCAMEEVICDTL